MNRTSKALRRWTSLLLVLVMTVCAILPAAAQSAARLAQRECGNFQPTAARCADNFAMLCKRKQRFVVHGAHVAALRFDDFGEFFERRARGD